MRISKLTSLTALTLMASASIISQVHASTVTGPYVSLGAGYNLTQTQHAHFAPGSFGDGENMGGGSSQLRHQNGYTGFGSFGWGFGNGLRAEVEGDYFYSQVNHLNNVAAPNKTAGGDRNYGGFINVLYDIDLKKFGINSPVTPYVGVGAGYLWSGERFTNIQYANGQNTRLKGDVGSFAYQGIIGASYDVNAVPGLAVFADYRMIGQTFENGSHTAYSSGPYGEHSGNVGFDHRFNHQFNIGVRYAFDTAPAPVQSDIAITTPVPSPARTYLVFFEWDKTDLSPRAKEIIDAAAAASNSLKTTSISVSGYADNSAIHPGPRGEAFNLKLSVKRADVVKAELIRQGVPANEIYVKGYGDTRPLVKTAINTREPQNRRVEIVLR